MAALIPDQNSRILEDYKLTGEPFSPVLIKLSGGFNLKMTRLTIVKNAFLFEGTCVCDSPRQSKYDV